MEEGLLWDFYYGGRIFHIDKIDGDFVVVVFSGGGGFGVEFLMYVVVSDIVFEYCIVHREYSIV